jgi:hypothetical protein
MQTHPAFFKVAGAGPAPDSESLHGKGLAFESTFGPEGTQHDLFRPFRALYFGPRKTDRTSRTSYRSYPSYKSHLSS